MADVKNERRTLRYDFTAVETHDLSLSLANRTKEKVALEDEKKSVVSQYKAMVSESNDYMQQWFNAGLIELIARNDGLTLQDFLNWFKHPSNFKGQIICWNENVNY